MHGTTLQTTEQVTPNATEEVVHECASCWKTITPDEPCITGEDIGCACKQSWHLHCLEHMARQNFFNQSFYRPYTCPYCRTSISKRLTCGEGKFAKGDPTLRCLYGGAGKKPPQAPVTLPVWVHQLTKGTELKMRPLHFNKFCKALTNNGTEIPNVFRMVKDNATHTGFLTVRHVDGGAVIRRKYNAFSGLITSV